MTRDQIFAEIKEFLLDALPLTEERITPEARFQEDLEADSLDLVELIMTLERSTASRSPTKRPPISRRVGDAVDFVAARTAG